MKEYHTIIGKTLFGLESLLAREVAGLGTKPELLHRAIRFQATKSQLYQLNYTSRYALRFLRILDTFCIENQQDLYQVIHDWPWESVMDVGQTFAIDSVIHDSVFENSLFVAQRAKDAIADRFRVIRGKRPSVDLKSPDFRINLHIQKKDVTLSLDSSGPSLHKRGYRQRTWEAPVSEVLAAGMIGLAEWDMKTPFYDPMCGSGTLVAEAAMVASNTPAGFFRKQYGFMYWADYDAKLWHSIKSEADPQIKPVTVPIQAADKARQAIHAAKINLQKTHLGNAISFRVSNFHHTKPPFPEGFLMMNPPYDERIQLDDAIAFYRSLGDAFKHLYPGWTAWMISSDLKALKFVGLKPIRRIPLYNGPLECRLVGYKLFEGKAHPQT